MTSIRCYLHFIVDQAGAKSDCWQLGKVRLTGTQTVKESPVAKKKKNVKLSPVIDTKAWLDRLY